MRRDLTKGSITEHLRTMALPVAIGLFFQALYNLTDAYYLSQLSVSAFAGAAISFPLYFLIIAIGSGIGIAINAFSSKAYGEGNREYAQLVASQGLGLIIALSIVVTVIGLTVLPHLLEIIGAKENVLGYALEYMQVIIGGLLFFFLTLGANGILNATGETRIHGIMLTIGFFINLVLDPIFMYGLYGFPMLGTAGVALATLVTELVAAVVLLYFVVKRKLISMHYFKPQLMLWKRIFLQGFSSALSQASVALGFIFITGFVAGFGESALAAFGIGVRIDQLIILPAIGIAIAAIPITGQNFGAKQFERIREAYRLALTYALIVLSVGMVVILGFAENIAAFFTADQNVVAITAHYLRISAIGYITIACMIISNSVLQGLGRAQDAVMIILLRFFIIMIPALILFTYFLQLEGVWFALLVTGILVAAIAYWYVLRTLKKLELLTKKQPL